MIALTFPSLVFRAFRTSLIFALGFLPLFTTSAVAQPTVTLRHERAGGVPLRGITTDGARVVAVGDGGRILFSADGRTWSERDSAVSETLTAVVFSGPNSSHPIFVAVGENGVVLTSATGETWTRAEVPGVTARFNHASVYAGRVTIVGDFGTIVRSTPRNEWEVMPSGTRATLRAVSPTGTFSWIALADDGQAFVEEGEVWRPLTIPGTPHLTTTAAPISFGTSHNRLDWLVAGPNGKLLEGEGSYASITFTPQATSTTAELRGIAFGRSSGLVVGDRGTLLFRPVDRDFTGEWITMSNGSTATLHAVTSQIVNAATRYFAVGENETIVEVEDRHHTKVYNLALRAESGAGARVLSNGFVIGGTAPKSVLLRAAGPALSQFAVPTPLAAPTLTVFDSGSRPMAQNTGWQTASDPEALRLAAQSVNAFAFANGSADSAVLLTLPPGTYTTQVSDRTDRNGIGLVELYDLDRDSPPTSRFVNLSARCFVGAGDSIAIPGVNARGNRMPRLLIRAVGPGLTRFGVENVLANPRIEVIQPGFYGGTRGSVSYYGPISIALNDDWNQPSTAPSWSSVFQLGSAEEIRAISNAVGAFALEEGSRDAVVLLTLDPGRHSIQISGANGGSGIALIEVYDVSEFDR